LLGFLPKFEHHDLLGKRLSPKGPARRLGIRDGSYMGGHWLVTLCLSGRINYPLIFVATRVGARNCKWHAR
jgi:hypothetical protein